MEKLPSDVTASPAAEATPSDASVRGVRFVLLAHPTVQALRFLAKAALAKFMLPEEVGEALFAGLIVFGVSTVAVCGMDEALIYARDVDKGLWDRMRRVQARAGIALALLSAAVGFALGGVRDHPQLGALLIALAPVVWCGNLAVLPTALLVRTREYKRMFLVDLFSILAFTATTFCMAWQGLGTWSLVGGWYANALVAMLAARYFARDLVPREVRASDSWPEVRGYGAHLTGAAALSYVGERLDSFGIGFVLGRAAVGLYEFALHLSQVTQSYAASLVDRFLFPALAARHRGSGLGSAYLEALRFTILVIVPVQVLISTVADPLIRTFFPAKWYEAALLLRILAYASAARCFDMVAVAALKAAGHGSTVFRLGWFRMLVLAAALAWCLPRGTSTAAFGVVASRVVAAAASMFMATRRLDLRNAHRESRTTLAVVTFAAWCAAFLPLAELVRSAIEGSPALALFAIASLALATWLLARRLIDHAAFQSDIAHVLARISRRPRKSSP